MSTDGADDGASGSAPVGPRERLAREAGVLPWSELVRHFARGVVVTVRDDVDLIDAALRFADDDAAGVGEWLANGQVARASDDDARDWTVRGPAFRCVVVAPWVLVQECRSDDGPDDPARPGGE